MDTHTNDRAAMITLLDGLLVGAACLMDSPGCWSDHLRSDDPVPSLIAGFIDQLGSEWPAAPPPDPFCERVMGQARCRIAAWHPGWPHLWAHVLRVTGAALSLTGEAGLDPALAFVMGMCHDVAKLDEARDGVRHEDMGAAFAGQTLRGHFSPGEIDSIQAAILKTGDSALAAVLSDADKLDKIGAAGVLRRISTGTVRAWVPVALRRVGSEAAFFPPMHFKASAAQARSKQAFLGWFLPLAEIASAGWEPAPGGDSSGVL